MNWKPIATAPTNRVILISPGEGWNPDLVRWYDRKPAMKRGGAHYLAVPAGWFCVNGSRSRYDSPTFTHPLYWCDVPEFDGEDDNEPVSARRLHVA